MPKAARFADTMISAAVDAMAHSSDPSAPGAALLPPMSDLQSGSTAVAIAVATTAAAEGHARVDLHNPLQQVTEAMWRIQ